jgi:hypothetical protein
LDTVLAAAITMTGGIVVAAMSFYLTKRYEQKAKWQQDKLNHYRVLLSSLSDWLGGPSGRERDDAKKRFALAINTITLVAPQDVIEALRDFVDVVQKTNAFDQQKWNRVLMAARRDIGIASADERADVLIPLVGYSPSDSQSC